MAFIDPYKKQGYSLQEYTKPREAGDEATEDASDAGVLRRSVDTVKGVYESVGIGAWRSLEGILDMVAGVVGGAGGLVSKDFQEGVRDVIEFNVTDYLHSEIFNRAHRMLTGRDYSEYSYLDDDHIVRQVAEGVGGMLPAVAVTVATGGAGAPAAVSQALSTATMATGAAGQATQEAYLDGAGYYQGLAYGGIRGGTEVATEKLFGGLDVGLFGKGFLPSVSKSVADTGVKRFVKGALQEGAEEMTSELLDPLARSVYQGKEAYKKYLDPAFYGDVWDAGVAGTLTGAAFSGTVGRALSGGSLSEDLGAIEEQVTALENKKANLEATGKLTAEAEAAIDESIRENYRLAETILKQAKEGKRRSALERSALGADFEADGSLKAEKSVLLDAFAEGRRLSVSPAEGGQGENTAALDGRYVSHRVTGDRAVKTLRNGGARALTRELSEAESKEYAKLRRAMRTLDVASGNKLDYVLAEGMADTNAYFDPDTGVVVIGADTLTADAEGTAIKAWGQALVHEVAHTTEGTWGNEALAAQLSSIMGDDALYGELSRRGYFKGSAEEVKAHLASILAKDEKGTETSSTASGSPSPEGKASEKLTEAEIEDLETFVSEGTAIMAEQILGDGHFIRRLVAEQGSVAEKILLRLTELKESLSRMTSKDAKSLHRAVAKAERLYLKAVEEAGYRFEGGKFVGNEEEDEEISESKKSVERYSYEYFVAKDDMPITVIDDTAVFEPNKETREGVVNQAQKNAIAYGATINENGNPVIHVADADLDVILGKNGLRHGLDRRLQVNAPVTLRAGEILANAIRINELKPRKETITASYVLIGVAKNARNEPYIVEFVVNQSTNEVTSVDVLYSVNAKTTPSKEKESAGSLSPEVTDLPATLTDSTISIAQLLDFVNRYYPDIMPEDVYRHYGHEERPKGELGKSVKYSKKAKSQASGDSEAAEETPFEKAVRRMEEQSPEMLGFYHSVLNMQDRTSISKRRKKLGVVSESHAKLVSETIKKETGKDINVSGFELWIDGSAVEHIKRRHGENGEKDHSMQNDEDIARIPWVANSAGAAEVLKKDDGSFDMDYTYRNADDSPSYKIRLTRNIGDSKFYVTECVPDSQNKRMYIKTAYIQKSSKGQALNMESNDPPQLTSETLNGSNATNGSIAQSEEVVKASDEKKSVTTDRELLLDIAKRMVGTEAEYAIVKEYEERIGEQNQKQKKVNDLMEEAENLRTTLYTDEDPTKRKEAYAKLSSLYVEMKRLNEELAEVDRKLTYIRDMRAVRNLIRSEKRKYKTYYRDHYEVKEKTRRESSEMVTRERMARRVIGRLNTMFFNPTKTNHVPPELQALVEKVLASENLGRFKDFRKNMREIAEVERAIERLEQNPAKTGADQDRLDKLHYKYKMLEGETLAPREQAEALLTAYKLYAEKLPTTDKVLLERLEADIEAMEKKPLSEMGLESIKAVEEFYKLIYHQIQNSNKLFSEEREQRVSDMGNEVMKELMEAKVPAVFGTKAGELTAMGKARSFLWKNVKPLTAFEIIGSSKLKGLFLNVMKGEEVWARDIQDAREFILEAKKKYGFDEWDLETRKEFTDAEGKTVKLNLSELMSLYAYSFRDQAVGHLTAGGFVLSSHATDKTGRLKLERSLNDATRYVIGQEEIMDIASLLTKEQQEFVQTLQGYLSDVMGKKGNEVSMKLYGMELFREKFYFPIKSKNEYLEAHTGRTGDPNIKNRGMAKEVVPDAKNPLVLEDFMDICVEHINSMATYHAFVLPVEDLMRVYNYAPSGVKQNENGEWVKDEENDGDFSTIQAAIVEKYGEVATGYIEQVIRDLNGGARRDAAASLLDRGLTAFKRASTMLSLSTIIQQPTSVARAMAYINVKYFAGDKVLKGKHREKWRAVMEAAPVAVIKDMGGYDTGVGSRTQDYLKSKEYETLGEKFGGFFKDGDYRAEVFGRGAAFADEVAWISIYEACVREQADKLGVSVDSKPAMMMGAKRFAEVIRRTQVYDSTLTRTEIMRSKDTGAKMVTAFMAEPSTVVNMMIDGIVRASRGDWAFMGKTVGAVTAAIILNSILVSLVYAMRDDDEDQNYGEKYLESLLWELSEGVNPAEYFPYLRDIMSLVKGYDVERSDMTLFAQLIRNVQSITSDRKTPYEKVVGVAGAVSSFFGLPVKNVERDVRGLLNTVVGAIRKDPEEDIPDAVRQEMNRLVVNGMDVLPRGVGDVITYEGQSVKLTAKQKAQFRKVYGEANEAVSRMVSMKLYTGADDEAKAKAIKRLYGIYYNRAIEDLLGVDIENKNVLMSRAVDPAQLSIIAAVCAGLGADVGKDGKAITGSKKAKVISYLSALNLKAAQKHLILGYLGYKNTQGEEKVRAYLAGLGLGRDEVKELLEIGGY